MEAHKAYLASHPEVERMLADLLEAILKAQPEDAHLFAKRYFDNTPAPAVHPPLVFVGPSGVGKGTLIARLMKLYGSAMGFSVSHTTRAARPGEEHGKHYHFSRRDSMQLKIDQGHFIEYANVHGNLYGTSVEAVQKVRESGLICVLDIDIQGLESVKKSKLNPRSVYIAPPSFDELERRLRGRGTETEESITKRLNNAKGEMDFLSGPGTVDCTIVNDDLDEAFNKLVQQVVKWYPHLAALP